jgi:thiol-disulfide isomerase/thioredoxin
MAIRRLRRSDLGGRPLPTSGPPIGTPLPEFSATTIDGTALSGTTLVQGQPTVLAFLATGCPACLPSVPHLLTYLDEAGLDATRVVVVVNGDDQDERREIVRAVGGAATVVLEPADGPTARAFSVTHFPTFVFADSNGTVEQTQLGLGPLRPKVSA